MKKSFITYRSLKFFLCILVFLFSLIIIQNAYLQPPPPTLPTYTVSAHGNTSYGVNRKATSVEEGFGYSIGNCAHCHEQHASIGGTEPDPVQGSPDKYILFRGLGQDQNTRFCYGCHVGQETPSNQVSMPYQYSYSGIAGGDTTLTQPSACPNDIKDAFVFINAGCTNTPLNCGSSVGSAHCLWDIQDFLKNMWNFPIRGDVQACSGCHNPHRAQRDPHTSTGRFVGERLVSPVSRPSQHSKDNNVWQLWGDDGAERMSAYALSNGGKYQAPCQYQWSSTCSSGPPPSCIKCEPDGSNIQDGSNMFDNVTFCLDCHQNSLTSTRLGTLDAIDWGPTGNQHGNNSDAGGSGAGTKAPYPANAGAEPDYVLSCLDCHEPHGSANEYLLRVTVNGTQVLITQSEQWCDWCKACHNAPHGSSNCGGMTGCSLGKGCHAHTSVHGALF